MVSSALQVLIGIHPAPPRTVFPGGYRVGGRIDPNSKLPRDKV
jgi:hypothetical protein